MNVHQVSACFLKKHFDLCFVFTLLAFVKVWTFVKNKKSRQKKSLFFFFSRSSSNVWDARQIGTVMMGRNRIHRERFNNLESDNYNEKLLKSTTFCFLTRCVIVISCKRKETYWGKVEFCKYMMKRKIYQQCCVYYVNPVEAKAPFQVKPTFWGGLTDRPGHPPVLLSGGKQSLPRLTGNDRHGDLCGMISV